MDLIISALIVIVLPIEQILFGKGIYIHSVNDDDIVFGQYFSAST